MKNNVYKYAIYTICTVIRLYVMGKYTREVFDEPPLELLLSGRQVGLLHLEQ